MNFRPVLSCFGPPSDTTDLFVVRNAHALRFSFIQKRVFRGFDGEANEKAFGMHVETLDIEKPRKQDKKRDVMQRCERTNARDRDESRRKRRRAWMVYVARGRPKYTGLKQMAGRSRGRWQEWWHTQACMNRFLSFLSFNERVRRLATLLWFLLLRRMLL